MATTGKLTVAYKKQEQNCGGFVSGFVFGFCLVIFHDLDVNEV